MHEALRIESKNEKEDKEALKKQLVDKVTEINLKDIQVINTRKEIDVTNNKLIKFQTELENLKSDKLKLSKPVIKCDKCDSSLETYVELKVHKRQCHTHNKSSQYEGSRSFEPVSCFYCDFLINSEEELHHLSCLTEFDTHLDSKLIYQEADLLNCECCGAKCRDGDDLKRHLAMYHHFPPEIRSDQFQCDICPLSYTKKIDLDFHRRGCHWEEF